MTMLLGVASALCWGIADFLGGLQSRRRAALAVALWSQLAGALALLLVLALLAEPPAVGSVVWGIAGGVCSGFALVLFYRGLAVGVMSIVAPISACGALVPVVLGLAVGRIPTATASIGIVAALAGIVLVSFEGGGPRSLAVSRSTLALALGAALGFGLFYVFIAQGSAVPGASPLWSIAGARGGSLGLLLLIAVVDSRSVAWPGRQSASVALVGVLDTAANVFFAYATTQGDAGVAAVLSSLYPVATVLLGRVVLAERLTRTQGAGVTLALFGVALLSAA